MRGRAAIHYFRVLLGTDLPRTQTTVAERAKLVAYLPGNKRIVEIGVAEGFTTYVLAEASDTNAVIYGVDPFFRGRLGLCWGFGIAKKYNRQFLRSGKLKLVRRLSTQVAD